MSKKVLFGIIACIIVVTGVIIVTSKSAPSPTPSKNTKGGLSSLSTSAAPWPAESTHLTDRLAAIGIPLLGAEGGATHVHSHLDIYIDGQKTIVPADIGVLQNGISPVHTHDATGIIHIESPKVNATYTLGEFFNIWGVKLTDTSIGSYAADSTHTLAVYDNGALVQNPTKLDLAAHHEIVITYGTTQEMPKIASSYVFPAGL